MHYHRMVCNVCFNLLEEIGIFLYLLGKAPSVIFIDACTAMMRSPLIVEGCGERETEHPVPYRCRVPRAVIGACPYLGKDRHGEIGRRRCSENAGCQHRDVHRITAHKFLERAVVRTRDER